MNMQQKIREEDKKMDGLGCKPEVDYDPYTCSRKWLAKEVSKLTGSEYFREGLKKKCANSTGTIHDFRYMPEKAV